MKTTGNTRSGPASVCVTGAVGQLGSDIVVQLESAGLDVIGLSHEDIELASAESVEAAIFPHNPAVIINTAAFHDVEKCEEEPEKAFQVNAIGTAYLAKAAAELDATLIQVSTDYVFDGSRGTEYTESDCPVPVNAYGAAKLAGEHMARIHSSKHLVVRVGGLYGLNPCRAKDGDNFVKLMLRLAKERDEVRVVNDQVVSPTWTHDIARQMIALIENDIQGLIHVSSVGHCTWFEFAEAIFEEAGVSVRLTPVDSGEFPTTARRPPFSALSNDRLDSLGLNTMPDWRDALASYVSLLKSA